jgi:hypothetical protein
VGVERPLALPVEPAVSGAKTAVSAAASPTTSAMSPTEPSPASRSRTAVTRCEIGLTPTKASRTRGSVSGSTKTLLRKTNTKITIMPAPCTALGLRSTSPAVVNSQDRAEEKTTTRSAPASSPTMPPCASKPMIRPTTMTTAAASV